ncbi:MAG: DUF3786 domain-containing protein [Thermoguttaceae bacterium]
MLPVQRHLQRATELAIAAVTIQSDDQLRWLGAEAAGNRWRLPVLNETLLVDLSAERVATQAGLDVGPLWRILTLHYLATASRPDRLPPEITFADLATARSYAKVYRQRAIARLCATVGCDSARLARAAMELGGRAIAAGDAAFDFDMFPRLTLRLVWYAGDDELPPDASLLLPPNIESYFTAEDVVVLSERLVSRLAGQPWIGKSQESVGPAGETMR